MLPAAEKIGHRVATPWPSPFVRLEDIERVEAARRQRVEKETREIAMRHFDLGDRLAPKPRLKGSYHTDSQKAWHLLHAVPGLREPFLLRSLGPATALLRGRSAALAGRAGDDCSARPAHVH